MFYFYLAIFCHYFSFLKHFIIYAEKEYMLVQTQEH